jgi:hypothetical protein
MTDTAAAPAATTNDLALSGAMPLYGDPRPVTAVTHGDHAILPGPDDYTFAAKTALVPVTVDEFAAAALHYPIVFFGPERRAFVVTGLTADRNLFVGEDGAYAGGVYIPAYLRRYPFAFARDTEDRLRILCLDQASPRVGTTADEGARPLFDGDQPAELTTHALAFCQEMEGAEARTTMLAVLLDGHDLLQPQQAHQNTDGASTLLLDYLTVDPAKLEALGDDAFTEVRRTGALTAIYAQILSGGNWGTLQQRMDIVAG